MQTQRLRLCFAIFATTCAIAACSLELPVRTCQTDADCGSDQYCNSAGLCTFRGTPVIDNDLAGDPELDASLDVAPDEGQDLINEEDLGGPDATDVTTDEGADTSVTCEPSLPFCDGRQIMICGADGTSAEPDDLCDDPVQRCRAGECVSQPANYGIACEETDDCEDEMLVCLDEVCVTAPPGESGAPCWDDLECDEDTVCYELGDVCQEGNTGDGCTAADDCQFDLVCTGDDVEPGVCTVGALDSPCTSDDHCQFPLVCGPEDDQTCQRGVDGDPCDDDGNCSDLAPYCGPSNTCQDGEEGNGCVSVDDCADSLLCSTGGFCQHGNAGDECTSAADCAGSTPFCGPAGCQEGTEGQPCSDEVLHCQDALFCSTLGECRDGTEGDPCGDDSDCAGATPICGPFGCHDGTEGDGCFTSFDCADEAPICSVDNICQDGDEGDACSFDGDCVCDCGDGVCQPGEPFGQSREIELYEPCADMSPAFRDESCEAGGPAYDDGSSSWQRTNEPVEIPLVNGYIDSSVVVYWPLDDGVAVDSAGENDGEVFGATSAVGAFGDSNGGLSFEGDDDRVVSSSLGLDFTNMSLNLWFMVDSSGTGAQYVFSDTSDDDTNLMTMEDGTIRTRVMGGLVSPTSVDSYRDDKWHLATFVMYEDEYDFFLDGSLQYRNTIGTDPKDGDLALGIRGNDLTGDFFGRLDDLIIFNRLITPTEITAYYNSRQPYGTSMVSDAQEDFDDVRVTEQCGCCDEERVTHEIIGVRPHSDTDLDHIVAYWRLDGDPTDETEAHDGTNNGATPTLGRFGDIQGAMRFNTAESDFIDTNYAWEIGAGDSFTIEAWVRADDLTGESGYAILNYESNTYGKGQFHLSIASNYVWTSIRDDADTGDGNGSVIQYFEDLADGKWHHYAVVRDTENDTYALFIDGLRVDEVEDVCETTLNAHGLSFFIGASNRDTEGPAAYMSGTIDEVIIHNVARSADYIHNRANPGIPMVRFLASTDETANDGGHYDYNTYRLYWDKPDAEHTPSLVRNPDGGEHCEGLLSSCNGYVGWWRFDEGSGTLAVDSTTNRNHGDLNGTDGWPVSVTGIDGVALDFGGSGYVESVNDTLFDLPVFNIEAAFQPSSTTGDSWIIAHGEHPDTDFTQYDIYRHGADLRVHFEHPPGESGSSIEAVGVINIGQWYHAGFWHDADGNYALDLDYAEYDSGFQEQEIYGVEHPLIIGGRTNPSYGDFFDGVIDSVRIMNRALTPAELLHFPMSAWSLDEDGVSSTCLYGAEGTPCVEDTDCTSSAPSCWLGFCSERVYLTPGCQYAEHASLYAHYPLEETTGTIVNDTSGNGRHGTSGGAVVERGVPGVVGDAYRFDCDDCGSLAISLDGSTSWSLDEGAVEMWAWIAEETPRQDHFFRVDGDGCEPDIVLFRDPDSGQMLLGTSGDCDADRRSPDPLPTGRWSHIGVNWGSSGRHVFVDGERVIWSPDYTDGVAGTEHLWYFGGGWAGRPGEFMGMLDEICIYDEQLNFASDGVEGAACLDEFDCSDAAPICSSAGFCQDGNAGDICETEADCRYPLLCSPTSMCTTCDFTAVVRVEDLPEPRAILGSTEAVDGRIFLLGGAIVPLTGNWAYSQHVLEYTISTDTYRNLGDILPYGLNIKPYNIALADNGNFYMGPVIGTNQSGGWGSHSRVIEFNPTTETAVERADFGGTIWDMTAVNGGDGYIYFFGGWNGSQVRDIMRYDPDENTLTDVGDLPAALTTTPYQVILANNGLVYAVHGTTLMEFDPSDSSTTTYTSPCTHRGQILWHSTADTITSFCGSDYSQLVTFDTRTHTFTTTDLGVDVYGSYKPHTWSIDYENDTLFTFGGEMGSEDRVDYAYRHPCLNP